jgi:hypothetical protein
MLIHGQSHGGIAQGIGQALWEECVYDPNTAQLLSGSLMDYALPRADSLPLFQTEISEVPSTTNPLGMRGGGEGGITPGLAVVANAIVDALSEFDIEHIDLGKAGLMTLVRRHRAEHELDDPRGIDPHLGALAGCAGIQLDRIRNTNPAISTTLASLGAARFNAWTGSGPSGIWPVSRRATARPHPLCSAVQHSGSPLEKRGAVTCRMEGASPPPRRPGGIGRRGFKNLQQLR